MALTLDGISVSRGSDVVLRDISVRIGPGCTAVIGRNGSGKTSLLQTAAGLLQPESGSMYWNGDEYLAAMSSLKKSLGYMPQELDFPARLTPRRLISYLARLRFIQPSLGYDMLRRLEMEPDLDLHFEEISAGKQRLFGFAQALMGDPQLVLLDELTSNLGYEERVLVYQLVRTMLDADRRRVVVFSSQFYEDVDTLADRMILIDAGRVLFHGPVAAARAALNGKVFVMNVSHGMDLTGMVVSRVDRVGEVELARVICDRPPLETVVETDPTVEDACQWFRSRKPVG